MGRWAAGQKVGKGAARLFHKLKRHNVVWPAHLTSFLYFPSWWTAPRASCIHTHPTPKTPSRSTTTCTFPPSPKPWQARDVILQFLGEERRELLPLPYPVLRVFHHVLHPDACMP